MNTRWYYFRLSQPVAETSSIRCPSCLEWSKQDTWKDGESWCDDCDDYHSALVCPKCEYHMDTIWDVYYTLAVKEDTE